MVHHILHFLYSIFYWTAFQTPAPEMQPQPPDPSSPLQNLMVDMHMDFDIGLQIVHRGRYGQELAKYNAVQ